MSSTRSYRLNVRFYPERYRPHREIVDFLMEIQKSGGGMIGRHVEMALLAYIRAEREAERQRIVWPVSGVPAEAADSPGEVRAGSPRPNAARGAVADALADPVPTARTEDTESKFSTLARKIKSQLDSKGNAS